MTQTNQLHVSTPDDFLEFVVDLANKTRPKIRGSFANVQAALDESDVAFAVWQDRRESKGVGVLLIKGQQNLREIIADGHTGRRHIAAIPCISAEQAEALREVAGEKDGRH